MSEDEETKIDKLQGSVDQLKTHMESLLLGSVENGGRGLFSRLDAIEDKQTGTTKKQDDLNTEFIEHKKMMKEALKAQDKEILALKYWQRGIMAVIAFIGFLITLFKSVLTKMFSFLN